MALIVSTLGKGSGIYNKRVWSSRTTHFYWSGYRPITFTRMFEPRHNIFSNVFRFHSNHSDGPRNNVPNSYPFYRFFAFRRVSVAQQQSVGQERVRNSLVPTGFSFRQGNQSALLGGTALWRCSLCRALTILYRL